MKAKILITIFFIVLILVCVFPKQSNAQVGILGLTLYSNDIGLINGDYISFIFGVKYTLLFAPISKHSAFGVVFDISAGPTSLNDADYGFYIHSGALLTLYARFIYINVGVQAYFKTIGNYIGFGLRIPIEIELTTIPLGELFMSPSFYIGITPIIDLLGNEDFNLCISFGYRFYIVAIS